jgi:hypothetical protein
MMFLAYFTVGISVIFVSGFIKGVYNSNPKASVVFPTYYNYDKLRLKYYLTLNKEHYS